MKLVRNTTPDGKCKYALVRLDKIRAISRRSARLMEIDRAIKTLERAEVIEYGGRGDLEESFTIKLKDHFAPSALNRYREAVLDYANRCLIEGDDLGAKNWLEYADQIGELAIRSVKLKSKLPD